MRKEHSVRETAADLRRRAEARIDAERHVAAHALPEGGVATARLLHELQVHQIELELQNAELQQTEAALEKALAGYTDLYARAPVGYLTLAHDGEIQRVNLAGAQLLGKMAAQLVGRRLGAFVAADSLSTLNEFLMKVWGHLTESRCEIMTRSDDGSPGRLLALTGTASSYIACVIVDIGERKRSEAALVQSEGAYRQLFQSNPIPMCIVDRETTALLAANDPLLALYGFTREELLSMRFAELCYGRGTANTAPRLTGTSVHRTSSKMDIRVELSSYDIVFGGRPGRLVAIKDMTTKQASD